MNPFLENYEERVVEIHQETIKVNSLTEEVTLDYQKIVDVYRTEKQEKTYIYHDTEIGKKLFQSNLKASGRDLWHFILYSLPKDQDWINLKSSKVFKELGISRPTLYSAINQLVEAGLIAKKKNTEYWINPKYIFNGSRLKFIETHCPSKIKVVATIHKASTKTVAAS